MQDRASAHAADGASVCSLTGRFGRSQAQQGGVDNSLTAVSRLQQKPKGRVRDMVFLSPLDYNSVTSELQERESDQQPPADDI